MDILVTICARGGSKGIPNKNIKVINGKPLIYYTLNSAAKLAGQLSNVQIVLSTDDEEIKKTVLGFDFDIDTDYLRPDFLATDSAGKIDAIKDVLTYAEKKYNTKYSYLIDLDVTSPLRTLEDLTAAFALLDGNPEAYNIFSVSQANRNPYFNMVEESGNGFYQLCKSGKFLTRQSAPAVYDMNASFYIFRSSFFDDDCKSSITTKSLVYVMEHVCFDLDHVIDFDFMSYLLENNKLDFNL
jgi:CMP-N,N'-diacetyllegionaminic acid synthase